MSLRRVRRKVRLSTRRLYRYGPAQPVPAVPLRPGMNGPESQIADALDDLNIYYVPQQSLFGGNILGGAKLDFLLPDYLIDLEYAGPFHQTREGSARDVLRNIGARVKGYTVVTLYQRDLVNLKPRILDLIGFPAVQLSAPAGG